MWALYRGTPVLIRTVFDLLSPTQPKRQCLEYNFKLTQKQSKPIEFAMRCKCRNGHGALRSAGVAAEVDPPVWQVCCCLRVWVFLPSASQGQSHMAGSPSRRKLRGTSEKALVFRPSR